MTDITRKRGDTYQIELTLGEDVTGGTFLLTADPSSQPANSDNNIFQLVGTVVNASAGVVRFAVSAQDADHVGRYYYDVQMTRGGVVYTVAAGALVFGQDITK